MSRNKFLIIGLALLLANCKNAVLVERNELSLQNKPEKLKLICIDPRFYFEDTRKNYQLKKLRALNLELKKDIVKYAAKNHIALQLLDLNENSVAGYYDVLLRLKQNLLAANKNQINSLDNMNGYEMNNISKKVFVYAPKISFDFNNLSKSFNTPYFSYLGVYAFEKKLVLYHVIVNTDLSETIYREYKVIGSGLNRAKMAQMIYDSYALVNQELQRK